eukprot:scaffold5390_cov116-Isochrysis_galbana.AAC.19
MVVERVGEEELSLFWSSVARGDNLALCMLRDGGGSPLLMARSCVVRASCANASARSANRLRVYLQTLFIGVEGLVFKVYFVEGDEYIFP